MKITHKELEPIDFGGINIYDYTAKKDLSSSIAELTVPPNSVHGIAYSKKSDKYYYVINGEIDFIIDSKETKLKFGDVCIIKKHQRFDYKNNTDTDVKMILLHTPMFDLNEEVFEKKKNL